MKTPVYNFQQYLDTVNELKATFKIMHILMQIFPET